MKPSKAERKRIKEFRKKRSSQRSTSIFDERDQRDKKDEPSWRRAKNKHSDSDSGD